MDVFLLDLPFVLRWFVNKYTRAAQVATSFTRRLGGSVIFIRILHDSRPHLKEKAINRRVKF